jgi:hypothetical protein
MKEICQYCNSTLSTKGNLVVHQKNNKKCIEIQKSKSIEIKSDLKECEFCNKNISIYTMKRHLVICTIKKEKEYENKIYELEKIILQKDNKIYELEKIILQKDNKISELEKNIIKLQAENNIYEKDHQVITNLAQQPKTTTNTNNIINNLAVYDDKLITDRFTNALSNIKSIDLYDGQESISRLIVPCLKNDDGTQLYKCTDYSRGVYVKKDKHGNILKDINGKNLVELIEPIATKKAEELLEEDNNKRDKQRKIKSLKTLIDTKYNDLENLREHIKGYEINSDKWKYYNKKLKSIEDDIDKYKEEKEELESDDNDIKCDTEIIEIYDDKLTDGVYDIKNMKKDSTKFSKKLSKLIN